MAMSEQAEAQGTTADTPWHWRGLSAPSAFAP